MKARYDTASVTARQLVCNALRVPLTTADIDPRQAAVIALGSIMLLADYQQARGGDLLDFQDGLRKCGNIARAALAADMRARDAGSAP